MEELQYQQRRCSSSLPPGRPYALWSRHAVEGGMLEHDISLSRTDRYFGDPLPFNATLWMEASIHFPDELITVPQLAEARMAHLQMPKTTDPEYEVSVLKSGFSWAECASFFEVMADGTGRKVKECMPRSTRATALDSNLTFRRGSLGIMTYPVNASCQFACAFSTMSSALPSPTEKAWSKRAVAQVVAKYLRVSPDAALPELLHESSGNIGFRRRHVRMREHVVAVLYFAIDVR
ncbi:hypothetical protein LTR17_009579 [Elasticomyces elasticus]|nr:hypothetical protein LTR17_009579 [Elasticomyces elasticus]